MIYFSFQIFAFIIEGRNSAHGKGRRGHSGEYRRLSNSAEDPLTGLDKDTAKQNVIY